MPGAPAPVAIVTKAEATAVNANPEVKDAKEADAAKATSVRSKNNMILANALKGSATEAEASAKASVEGLKVDEAKKDDAATVKKNSVEAEEKLAVIKEKIEGKEEKIEGKATSKVASKAELKAELKAEVKAELTAEVTA